ncbi:MAG: GyrI-like domain-containing protein [Desulfobacterales bacterium]|nr:GyrI-like domain-containing protein [Desulfobacterales bacterium]
MPKLDYKVEIKDLPELTVAYARHVGPFDGIPEAFGRLARWAGPRGLFALPGAGPWRSTTTPRRPRRPPSCAPAPA